MSTSSPYFDVHTVPLIINDMIAKWYLLALVLISLIVGEGTVFHSLLTIFFHFILLLFFYVLREREKA